MQQQQEKKRIFLVSEQKKNPWHLHIFVCMKVSKIKSGKLFLFCEKKKN